MLQERRHWPVVVVGAGPAGLAVSRQLIRRRVEHVVLERGEDVGASWRSFYSSLVLHTGKHLSSLPDLPFERGDPLFTPRPAFVGYLERYAQSLELPVQHRTEVVAATPTDDGWALEIDGDLLRARVLVVATGIAGRPRVPAITGRGAFVGTVRHSIEYRDPQPFVGRRVLVVGAGNSGSEIASELGRAGIATTIAIRSGVLVVPLTVAGVPSQYIGIALRRLPRSIGTAIARASVAIGARRRRDGLPRSTENPLDVIPIVGMHLSDAIREGRVKVRAGLTELTGTTARFADETEAPFDDVILATGFTAAVAWLNGWIALDERGFARRRNRVVSADQGRLLFVGHSYDAGGGLVNIRRDAPLAAEAAVAMLGGGP